MRGNTRLKRLAPCGESRRKKRAGKGGQGTCNRASVAHATRPDSRSEFLAQVVQTTHRQSAGNSSSRRRAASNARREPIAMAELDDGRSVPRRECREQIKFCVVRSRGCRQRQGEMWINPEKGEKPAPYFPASSFFTSSLTTFPSTRIPAAANFAIAFFITVPISFIVGEPISAMVAFTPAAMSASLAAFGR